ncbi:hypothetical protein F4779DRAFT_523551 [Xylariaceae sp. FL0662B]|nr:hypothetical protein F4779DRAFT_523551 [Xylariaceae sp. FL0662B]
MAFPVINGTEVLIPPPEGWVVNFTHPYRNEKTKHDIYVAFAIEYPIATFFLAQRIYTSLCILRKFRADDYLIIISWGFLTATNAMMVHLLRIGNVGLHAWEQSLDTTIYMTGVIHALTLTAIIGTVLAKLVLCIFYYRLSPNTWYRYGILGTAFLCISCFGAVWFAVMFACKPVDAAWNLRKFTGDNCISRPPWYLLQAITGGVTDLLLMLQPIPTVLGLNMSNKQKAGLLAWFGIGTVTLAAACMRLKSLLSMLTSMDTPWTMAEAMLWLVIESNLIILCGCLPTFRLWLRTVFPQSATKGSYNNKHSGNSAGQAHPLRTFGAGSTRPKHQFDTIADIEFNDHFESKDYKAGVETGKPVDVDAGSEEHILQTRETTVTYTTK